MKKILLACNGDHFPRSAFKFADSVSKHEKILLKGVFMPSVDYSMMPSFAYANAYAVAYERLIPHDFYEEEEKSMDKGVRLFEDMCKEHDISNSINKVTGFESLQGLLDETRFSDLVLVESGYFFSAAGGAQPNTEMTKLLHDTECPVLLIPENPLTPGNILFAFDGETSCMASIKQFTRLMTVFANVPLTILFFSFSGGERPPFEENIMEYCKCHFQNVTVKIANNEDAQNLNKFMADYSNPLIVTGSYSRSGFSRVFKKSFISTVIAHHQYPVFLFHGK